MLSELIDDALARDFGKALAADSVPAELPFYDEVLEAEGLGPLKHRDRALAFGLPVETAALPVLLLGIGKVVLGSLWEIAKPLISEMTQEAAAEFKKALSTKLKSWIANKFLTPTPLKITSIEIDEIESKAKEILNRGGADPHEAQKILESLRKSLTQGAAS